MREQEVGYAVIRPHRQHLYLKCNGPNTRPQARHTGTVPSRGPYRAHRHTHTHTHTHRYTCTLAFIKAP